MPKLEGYVSEIAFKKKQALLERIRDHGLFPSSEEERLRSFDEENFTALAINEIDFSSKQITSFASPFLPRAPMPTSQLSSSAIKEITCNYLERIPLQGAWPIIIERSDKRDFIKLDIEHRLHSSIMFVLKADSYEKTYVTNSFLDPFTPSISNITSKFGPQAANCCYFQEVHTVDKLDMSKVIAILVPEALEKLTQGIFKENGIVILAVKSEEKTLRIPGEKLHSTIERDFSLKLSGPNYVAGLQQIIKMCKLEKFATHVVRLPTPEDVLTLYKSDLSEQAILEFYQKDASTQMSLEKALRMSAANCVDGYDIDYLVQLKVNINAKDNNPKAGKTAAHLAIEKNQTIILQRLLRFPVDLTIQDANGLTIQESAERKKYDLEKLKPDLQRDIEECGKQEMLIAYQRLRPEVPQEQLIKEIEQCMIKAKEEKEARLGLALPPNPSPGPK